MSGLSSDVDEGREGGEEMKEGGRDIFMTGI